MDLLVARPTDRLRCGFGALILAALVVVVALAVAAPAQAHEPWGAKAWGINTAGQLGDGTTEGPEKICGPAKESACSTVPVAVSNLSGVTAIAGGSEQASAALADGTDLTWGSPFGFGGSLGTGHGESRSDVPADVCAPAPEPCPRSHLSGVTAVASGEANDVALLQNGTVMTWGGNFQGQLGDGGTASSSVPVGVCEVGYSGPAPCPPENYLKEVKAIADARYLTGYALLDSGKVVAWGYNAAGQLGDGSTTNSDVPVEVKGLSGVSAIGAGNEIGLAVTGSAVMTWGQGGEGYLGDGTETSSDEPVGVCEVGYAGATPCPPEHYLKGVSAVAGGGGFGLALLSSGHVVSWGLNASGQLGDFSASGPENCGTFHQPCSKIPVAVCRPNYKEINPCTTLDLLSGVSAIATGQRHALALSAGDVVAWGENTYGELGNGTSTGPEPCPPFSSACSRAPVEVRSAADAKGIAAGDEFSLAFGPTAPTVTGVSPKEPGKSGATTKVTITGSEFEEATEVKFGSAKSTAVVVKENGTIIEATAPAGKGIVDVTVTTPVGTSATSEADRFYYQRPTINKLSPRKGPELGGTLVSITGTNLGGATAVKFGPTSATEFKVKSETEIVAVSPSHPNATVDVTVRSPNGTSAVTKKDRFKYR